MKDIQTLINCLALLITASVFLWMLFTMFDPKSEHYPKSIIISMRGAVYMLSATAFFAAVMALRFPFHPWNIAVFVVFALLSLIVLWFHEKVLKLRKQ